MKASRYISFNLLFLILVAWAGYHWLHTVQRVTRFYNPLPADDYWRVPIELHNYQQFNIRALWRQHNEHRILVPELFFAGDTLLFHGEQFLPLAVSFLAYVGCWILVVMALNSDRSMSRSVRRFAAVLSALIIGWPGNAFVLSAPFLLQWTLTQLAVCLSLVLLWRHKVSSRNFYLWTAIFAAVVATYSSGNGIFLWPVLLIAAFVLELPKRTIGALAVSGFLSIALYFIGYTRTGTLHVIELIRHPLYALGFLCAYLSMPLGAERSNFFSFTAGFACIALSCYFLWLARRNRLLRSAPAVLFFGFFAFAMLTGVLTAAGRMDISHDIFFVRAKQIRYVTMPLLNWAFFVAAALWIADRIRSKGLLAVNAAMTAVILFLLISFPARDWARSEDAEKADQQLATLDVENGLPDIKLTKSIFPNVELINQYSPDLERNHLSIYYNGPAEWLGKPLSAFFKDFGPAQNGKITLTVPIQHGLELAGTADIPAHTALTDPQILFANGNRQIVGFGRHLHAGVAHQLANAWPPALLQWVGFINLTFDSHVIHAYLVSDSKLFPLAVQIPIVR